MAALAASRQMSTLEVALRTFGARLFEAAPGLVTWVLLLAPAWIPIVFTSPGAFAVAGAVLVFDVYWLFRSVSVMRGVYRTYSRMRRDMSADWLALCEQDRAAGERDPLQFIHLSIIPTYTEPFVVGKSAAMNWGGRWMVRVLTDEGYELNRILITDLDSDYRVHPQYFAWISWHHSREPLRDYTIWQPVPLFHNNIWQVPMAVRVMSASTSQWQMFLHSQPHRLVAFSSYTCSLEFVHRVGYWDNDVIPEDSRFYWKAFFTFGKRFAVRSVYLPLYGDSPKSRDYASTHQSQYNQIKRWAWGVTDVPYVLARLFKHPEIPFGLRLRRFSNLFVNHLNWIFLPVLLMFGSSAPIWFSIDFSLTDVGQQVWSLSGILLTITLSTVFFFMYLEFRMLPPKPVEWPRWRRTIVHFQYFAYPVVGLVLSVLPALEAHTRLLLGRYLEYRVTEKT